MFRTRHDTIGTTEIDADETWFDARNGAGDDGADFIFEGCEYSVVFGFTETLDDDLLGSLSGNAAETFDGEFLFDGVADFEIFALGLIERNFGRRVEGDAFFDDFANHVNVGFAGLGVEGGADVHVAVAVVFAPGGSDGLLDDVKYGLLRQAFFLCDDVNHGGHLLQI